MNPIFSVTRFLRLCRLTLSENKGTYLIQVGVVAGVLMLTLPNSVSFSRFNPTAYVAHEAIYLLVFTLSACKLASDAFAPVHQAARGMSYLLLPASNLEKFLSALVVPMLYTPLFAGLFNLIEGIYFAIANGQLPAGSQQYRLSDALSVTNLHTNLPAFLGILTVYAFLTGSIFFRKAAFIKTAIVVLTLLIAAIFLNKMLLKMLVPDSYEVLSLFPFTGFGIQDTARQTWPITPPDWLQHTTQVVWALVVPILWYITYIRFKEKEI